ncbi:spore germination protein [Paenibacillus abyssi]|uniref:Spore germination protein n=1 Tax=Paenibacillus abyssi TaxID=1340531 RepID=A0A917CXD5_9BACL|nr:spore germination protein [Paenibacillus abyssi]GGG03164.1 spore germination protein [Paenibacillus abyssi]
MNNHEMLSTGQTPISIDALERMLSNMTDAEIIDRHYNKDQKVTLLYIETLINPERLNESVIEPLNRGLHDSIYDAISSTKVSEISTMEEAEVALMRGCVILHDPSQSQWWSVLIESSLSRAIESSETETILYGPKDSFSEQLEQNITMIRRRLPLTTLKAERFTVGSTSKTPVVMMYIEGLTNPEFVDTARSKIIEIDFDLFLDSSHLAAFMEDHTHSVFPQYQQTDRPDTCAYALDIGKLTILVGNTPFALIAPITFFHLFQSPEDYINRWLVASFLRIIRYLSFFLSLILIPLYVALSTHHYQMIPMQILFVLLESRSKLPFSPFWEALLMLITLEIIKEASLRMPSKSGQTLGVIGGIVIGEATVSAGFSSTVLIVLVGISAIASFLVPNYLVTKSNTLIQFGFLVLSSFLGLLGIVLGIIGVLAHLNSLTSLKQPYFAPLAPFYWRGWMDVFIRGPLKYMKSRPEYLHPLQRWRYGRRR